MEHLLIPAIQMSIAPFLSVLAALKIGTMLRSAWNMVRQYPQTYHTTAETRVPYHRD